MLCGLVKAGLVEPRAYRQNETFAAAVRFARSEGILPAPEPAHAIRAVIEEAEAADAAGEERAILFNLCGHGHFDMSAYDAYLAGTLEDPEFSEEDMERGAGAPAGGAGDRLAAALALALLRGGVGPVGLLGLLGPRPAAGCLAGRLFLRRSPMRRCGVGHGSASPVSHAGPRPPGQRPRNRPPSAPSQKIWTIGHALAAAVAARSGRRR